MAIQIRTHLTYHRIAITDIITMVSLNIRGLIRPMPSKTTLNSIYNSLLGRAPDPTAEASFLKPTLSIKDRYELIKAIINSLEYSHYVHKRVMQSRKSIEHRNNRFRRILKFPPSILSRIYQAAHHQARVALITHHVPPAKAILDLGGGSKVSSEGALLHMGYPHTPEKIAIVDLHPEDRVASSYSTLDEKNTTTKAGTQIEYIHDSFVNLERFADESYDMIFSGQTIEHISQEDALKVFSQAWRILKPGGRFCLDTPNRDLTILLNPRGYIHDEHFYEYTPQEIIAIAEANGFEVDETFSVSPMPITKNSRTFDYHELISSPPIGSYPEEGFSFYLNLRKKSQTASETKE